MELILNQKKLMPINLKEKFNLYCNSENLEVNQNQILVIKRLHDYYKTNFKSFISNLFSKKNLKKSFYLYGDVGVGKTMIMDFFYNQINEKKTRLHFNEFMLSFHNFVHERKDEKEQNIINLFVRNLKSLFFQHQHLHKDKSLFLNFHLKKN